MIIKDNTRRQIMRKSRLFMSAAAACLAGTMAVTGFAATEHWNDNSGKKAISDEW